MSNIYNLQDENEQEGTGTGTGRKATFTAMERAQLKRALYVDGKPPMSFGQKVMDRAEKLYPVFAKIYATLVLEKNGDYLKANNAIRKSIGPKKKSKK